MQGFDPKFQDFPEYILTTTREIWEDHGLARGVAEYLHPDVIQRSPLGVYVGADQAKAQMMATLVAIPDRSMMSEDVIWSGSDAVGFLGSQRILSTGTHKGAGVFGAPTGRKLRYRVLTDSYAKANQISDVWSVQDTGAILRQLGLDGADWARDQLSVMDPAQAPLRPAVDVVGPYTGPGNASQWGVGFASLLTQMMEGEFSVVAQQYDRACHLCYPGGLETHGPEAAEAFWMGLRSSFPSARFEIHHRIGMEEPLMPARAAVRWSLTGRHDGWGTFGRPTGAEVHVMGMSHAEFGPWGLRREWTLIDEAAIWMQIQHTIGG